MKQNDNTQEPDPRQILKDIATREAQKAAERKPAQPEAEPKTAENTKAAENGAKGDGGEKPKEAGGKSDSIIAIIKGQADEGERTFSNDITLGKILGGDILNASIIRRQIWVIVIIAFFIIISISNRYSCQQDLIRIDKLTRELQDAKYRALSSNSDLTEQSRESKVLEKLKNDKDSTLHIATQPPYIIEVPQNSTNE